MQARDIMTRPPITFGPDTSILDAAAVLRQNRIAAAPVVGPDGKLVGMVTKADLLVPRLPAGVLAQHPSRERPAAATQTVGQVMTTTVIAMSPSSRVASLARAMFDYDLRTIPIVIGMVVVGVVSRRDLLRTLVHDDDAIRAEPAGSLAGPAHTEPRAGHGPIGPVSGTSSGRPTVPDAPARSVARAG